MDFNHLAYVSGISVYVWYVLISWIPFGVIAVLIARYLGNAPAHLFGDAGERHAFRVLLFSGPLGALISLYYVITNLYEIYKYRKILKEIQKKDTGRAPKNNFPERDIFGFPKDPS